MLFQKVYVKSVLETEMIHTPVFQVQDAYYY
jgi:hypothetical protein